MTLTVTATASTDVPNNSLDLSLGTTQSLPVGGTAIGVGIVNAPQPPEGYDPIVTTSGGPVGIIWYGYVTTPAAFISGSDSGKWGIAQIFTSSRHEMFGGTLDKYLTWTLPTPHLKIEGLPGLDNHFPYGDGFDTGWFLHADGTHYDGADAPNVVFEELYNFSGGDNFDDYMMYVPPGSGSVPVPLKKFMWSWSANAVMSYDDHGKVVWTVSNTHQSKTDPVDAFGSFPAWTRRYDAAHIIYDN